MQEAAFYRDCLFRRGDPNPLTEGIGNVLLIALPKPIGAVRKSLLLRAQLYKGCFPTSYDDFLSDFLAINGACQEIDAGRDVAQGAVFAP